jgi:hypothetical protein
MTLAEWAAQEKRCTPHLRRHVEDDGDRLDVYLHFDDPDDVPAGVYDKRQWRKDHADEQQKGVKAYLDTTGIEYTAMSLVCGVSFSIHKDDGAVQRLVNIGNCEPAPLWFDHISPACPQ